MARNRNQLFLAIAVLLAASNGWAAPTQPSEITSIPSGRLADLTAANLKRAC